MNQELSRKFYIGDLLAVTTGVLTSPEGIESVIQVMSFMTQDRVQVNQLIRCMEECTPYLKAQHPFLNDITERMIQGPEVLRKVADLAVQYGEYHEVKPIPLQAHERLTPAEDFRRSGFESLRIIEVDPNVER